MSDAGLIRYTGPSDYVGEAGTLSQSALGSGCHACCLLPEMLKGMSVPLVINVGAASLLRFVRNGGDVFRMRSGGPQR